MARDWEQVTGQSAPGARRERPPRIRRLLRRGPRVQPSRDRTTRNGAGAAAQTETPAAGRLAEWYDMTAGEQIAAWASLRAWVTWLHDRYELSVEDRLPRCWPSHPGLIEELAALKAWREEIYSSGQPSGQAARYWHAELRQVLHAATTQYALGCRTGHRGAASAAATGDALSRQWAAADPMARIPGIELAAGTARRSGRLATVTTIGAALGNGDAIGLPGTRDTILYQGTWWAPASAGWTETPRAEHPGLPTGMPGAWTGPPTGGTATQEGEPDPWKA
jgi:hypothetical protein